MSNVVFFNGVDGVITVVNSASTRIGGDMTIECLFKPNYSVLPTSYYTTLFRKGDPYVPGGEYALYLYSQPKAINFVRRNATDTATGTNGYTTPIFGSWWEANNNWWNISAVHSGTSMMLYVNGHKRNTTVIAFANGLTANNNVQIFGPYTHYFGGLGASARMYNRALSDTEVAYNAAHPNNPIRQGLALNFTQESIYGTQWNDLSGNANHGTYVNGALPMRANLVTQR